MQHRIRTVTTALVTTAVLGLGLAGCTVQANRTVSADRFATTVADALEESVGQRPDVDCGDDAIDVVDGEEVHCDISEMGADTIYDSVTTISTENGEDYRVAVEVDQEPKD
jgi:hypothetical protein